MASYILRYRRVAPARKMEYWEPSFATYAVLFILAAIVFIVTQSCNKLTRPRVPLAVPSSVNQRWSVDFISDQLANGRRFRVFNVDDDFSRECLLQVVDFSIGGERLARELDLLAMTRTLPKKIVLDNGPELTSKAMFFWSKRTGV